MNTRAMENVEQHRKNGNGTTQALETFYFGEDSHRMYGALHLPAGKAHTGLVFCPSYGDEMVVSYTPFARWAKELAQKGFAVFRYHPYGVAESDGTSADFSFESAVADAIRAARFFQERVTLDRIGFVGLRFGGRVAIDAALQNRVDLIVLWSPILSLRQYCRDLMRLRLTTELVHQQAEQVRITSRGMIEELEAGRSIDLLGLEMSPEFYKQMNADPPLPENPPAPEVLWLARSAERITATKVVEGWNKGGQHVNLQVLSENAFWEEHSSDFPREFANASLAWLLKGRPR